MTYAWEGHAFNEIKRMPQRRDPRAYQIGYAATDGTTTAIQWFRRVPELAQFILRMEPQRWGYRLGALIAHKNALQPVITEVDVKGLQPDLLDRLNDITRPTYEIAWWGTFKELCTDEAGWPAAFRREAGVAPDAITQHLRARTAADED